MSALLLYTLFLLKCQCLQGAKLTMSRQHAEEECSKTGKSLVSYNDIKANPSAPEYLTRLNYGESAWIDGYAELSPFLSWEGCFSTKGLRNVTALHTITMSDSSLFLCSKQCGALSLDLLFIGMEDTNCHCITTNQRARAQIQYAAVNDSLCSNPCVNNVIDSCGGDSVMSVYRILESIPWALNEPSASQCVYVKKKDAGKFEAYTASCLISSLAINGYICSNSAFPKNILETTNCLSVDKYCVVEEENTSRKSAVDGCLKRNGTLSDLSAEAKVTTMMVRTWKVWIDVYRTFGISERYINNQTLCLAATKLDNRLYLEPDSCKSQKYYLCKSKELSNAYTVHSTIPVSATTLPATKYLITNPTQSVRGTLNANESVTVYIALILSIIALIISAIVSMLVYIWLRRLKRQFSHESSVEDYYLHTSHTEGVSRSDTVPGDNAVSSPILHEANTEAESSYEPVADNPNSHHVYEGLKDRGLQNTYDALVL